MIRSPRPIDTTRDVVAVNFVDFATIPDVKGEAPRIMHMTDEPGTRRLFVSLMTGALYSVSYDGKTVAQYLDLTAAPWSVPVQSEGSERGVQSFAFHPQFNQPGTPGFGKFYTYTDVADTTMKADFVTPGTKRTQDTVLLEWTAKDPAAATYDGDKPRELFRAAQPFGNHNGGQIAFNPLAKPGTPDFGLLYVGFADGGSGGDPLNVVAEPGVGVRQDPAYRSARQEQHERQLRRAGGQPVRGGDESRRARRDLCLRRPQPAALLLGFEGRQALSRRHRAERGRGDQPGDRRRQSRVEPVGGELPLREGPGRSGEAAERSRADVAGRRVRPPRSAVHARGDHRRRSSTARAPCASCRT